MGNDLELLKSFAGLVGVPIIIALVGMLKGFIADSKWYGLTAMIIGIVINVTVYVAVGSVSVVTIVAGFFSGIIAGLAASGAYSTMQTVATPRENPDNAAKASF